MISALSICLQMDMALLRLVCY